MWQDAGASRPNSDFLASRWVADTKHTASGNTSLHQRRATA
jgi:hypothetical protein